MPPRDMVFLAARAMRSGGAVVQGGLETQIEKMAKRAGGCAAGQGARR